eukprot:CAMPEP_0172530880 /NCGR_PEP_ID=MMETSP1067-20121228/4492_1 /TAXON_ID=265564 ORGANISM="Thalassiosira punctigera, Strain Tpunct2005C2" /NCGR_SAMPLE_ID=MMETSP1067 /ASSEMBLY_ACC=CAM_ASM_000444 /LENGTH=45 /DNA_ID= /DNA_START= /DNA_END= /DNA_ORIENTATION=
MDAISVDVDAILFVDARDRQHEEPRCDDGGVPTRWDVRCVTGIGR